MTLRLRRSHFMNDYFKGQAGEEKEMNALLNEFGKNHAKKKIAKRK